MKTNKFLNLILIIISLLLLSKINNVYADTCPTADDYDKYKVDQIIAGSDRMKIELNESNEYIVTFYNVGGLLIKEINSNQEYLPDENGNLTIIYGPKTNLHFEFFIHDETNACNGTQMGYVTTNTYDTIINPYYYSDACTTYRSKCGDSGKTNLEFCYTTITFPNAVDFYSTKLNDIKEMASSCDEITTPTAGSITNTLKCDWDGASGTYKATGVKMSNQYCRVTCDDVLNVKIDEPKVTYAGGGFEYEIVLEETTKCSYKIIKTPTKPTVCVPTPPSTSTSESRSGSCSCNGGKYNNKDDLEGGPNEDFDACVLACDGGKYTQDCINQCYESVYEKKTYNSATLSYFNQEAREKILLTGFSSSERCNGMSMPSYNGSSYGKEGTWNCIDNIVWCWIDADCGATCTAKDVVTTTHTSTTPGTTCPSDSVTTEAEAQRIYEERKAAYSNAIANCNKEATETTATTIKNNDSVYTVKNPINEKNTVLSALSEDGKTINFSRVCINKLTGDTSYVSVLDPKVCYDGGYKFYTSPITPDTNFVLSWPGIAEENEETLSISDERINWNINNTINGVGLWNQWNLDLNCFYGLVNKYYCRDEEDCPTIESEGSTGGIQYIFRAIDLNDVFPNNRDPRWNWTCGATNLWDKEYPIRPVELTSDIEARNYSIYENESQYLDYEIELTKEKMKVIRQYNAGNITIEGQSVSGTAFVGNNSRSYTDYYATCYIDNGGKEVCKSNFLDWLGDALKIRGYIGCNNQSGSGASAQCDDSTALDICYFYWQERGFDAVKCKPYIKETVIIGGETFNE